MNKVLQADLQEFAQQFALGDELRDSRFLITGASGLIGSCLIHCLLALQQGIHIVAPVRNLRKAQALFTEQEQTHITWIEGALEQLDYQQLPPVDYIVHGAAPTSSRFFVEHPVETFRSIVDITGLLLEYARRLPLKAMVLLSSLEVYGTVTDDTVPVGEEFQGYLDPLQVRSSYPMAKRAAENLCCLYAAEYGVPVRIARLTQTTGAGLAADDNRVIVQFARLAAAQQDIVLHTEGHSARPYCYTTDAVSALLFILLRGTNAQAYNVARADSYISARNLAFLLQRQFAPSIQVRFEGNENQGYAPPTLLRLSTQRLEALGWQAQVSLDELLKRVLLFLESICPPAGQ